MGNTCMHKFSELLVFMFLVSLKKIYTFHTEGLGSAQIFTFSLLDLTYIKMLWTGCLFYISKWEVAELCTCTLCMRFSDLYMRQGYTLNWELGLQNTLCPIFHIGVFLDFARSYVVLYSIFSLWVMLGWLYLPCLRIVMKYF